MYLHLKFCQQESPELLNAQQVIIALQDQVRQLYAQQELITQSKAKEYQQHVLLVQQVSLFQAQHNLIFIGKYCAGTANTQPDGDCTAGYYCVAGSDSATEAAAPAGSFSGAGAGVQTLCYPGTFQASTGQSSCSPCTAGNYCPGFGNDDETVCPAGSYCPASSDVPTPCPIGTFSASTGLDQATDCTPCTAGKYCDKHGLTAVSGDCAAGYFCRSYAISDKPTQDASVNDYFGPCHKGYYCPLATGNPVACPAGKYLDAIGADALADCKACLAGKYCAGTANEDPDGD